MPGSLDERRVQTYTCSSGHLLVLLHCCCWLWLSIVCRDRVHDLCSIIWAINCLESTTDYCTAISTCELTWILSLVTIDLRLWHLYYGTLLYRFCIGCWHYFYLLLLHLKLYQPYLLSHIVVHLLLLSQLIFQCLNPLFKHPFLFDQFLLSVSDSQLLLLQKVHHSLVGVICGDACRTSSAMNEVTTVLKLLHSWWKCVILEWLMMLLVITMLLLIHQRMLLMVGVGLSRCQRSLYYICGNLRLGLTSWTDVHDVSRGWGNCRELLLLLREQRF